MLAQPYAHAMTDVGACTQPWLALSVFSLPGPKAVLGSHGASCKKMPARTTVNSSA
jgi:hypothetical protein